MRTKKFAIKCKRVLAVVLTFAMMLTTFVDGSFVSKASNESFPYIGEVDGNELTIDMWMFDQYNMKADEETIIAVLNSYTQNFERITFWYNEQFETSVPAGVWNAAVNKLDVSENACLKYAIDGEEDTLFWYFYEPRVTDSTVNLGVDINIEDRVTVCFEETNFPVDRLMANWSIWYDNAEQPKVNNVLGWKNMDLECIDSNGSIMDGAFSYNVNVGESGIGSELRFNNIKYLSAGIEYTLQQKSYRGQVSTNSSNDWRSLMINAQDAGKEDKGLSEQEILNALSYYEEGSFDSIEVVQPLLYDDVIYKKVVDTAKAYLKDSDANLRFRFEAYEQGRGFSLILPGSVSMTADQKVETYLGFDVNEKPYIWTGDLSKINAEEIEFSYRVDRGTADADYLMAALGDSGIYISAGDDAAEGYYSFSSYTVSLSLYDIKNLDPKVNYPIAKRAYKGEVHSSNGNKQLQIDYRNMEDSGMEFNEESLLRILNSYYDRDFNQIYFYMPAGVTEVSAELWNASLRLLQDTMINDGWYQLQFGISGDYTTNWSFNYPYADDQPVTLGLNMNWSTDGSGASFSLPRTQYPASNVSLNFNTVSGSNGMAIFEAALGTNRRSLEVVDSAGNVQSSYSDYRSSSWDGGYNRSLDIGYIVGLKANEMYKLQSKTYRGSEWNEGDENYNHLEIYYWGFNNTEVEYSEDAVVDILEQKAASGKKYLTVALTLPDAGVIPADLWNAAVAVLKSRAEAPEYSDVNLCIVDTSADESRRTIYWNFQWPEMIAEDSCVDLRHELVFAENYAEITFENTAFPAEYTRLSWETSSNISDFEGHMNAFGERSLELELVDEEGNVASRGYCSPFYYNDPYIGINVEIYMVSQLESGKTYRMQEYMYRGNIESWEDGDGNYHEQLVIHYRGFGKDWNEPCTAEELVALLESYEGRTFDEIYITQCYTENNTISASVVNAAAKLFDPERGSHLVYGFQYDDEYINWGYQWAFENVRGMNTDFSGIVSKGENGSVAFESDMSAIDAEYINYHTHYSWNMDLAAELYERWGDDRKDLIIDGSEAYAYYEPHVGEEVWLSYYDVGSLEPGQMYDLLPMEYQGDAGSVDGYSWLNIYAYDFEEYGQEFSVAAVLDILESRYDAGQRFCSVMIELPAGTSKTVSKKLWNASQKLLTASDWGESDFTISFAGNDTFDERWTFINPQPVNADITMKSTLTFGTGGKGLSLKFSKVEYPAERVDWGINTNSRNNDTGKFDAALGNTSKRFDIALSGKATGVTGEYSVWGSDELTAYDLLIMGVNELVKDKTYKTQEYVYKGNTEELEDGTTHLWIHAAEAGYEVLSKDEIISILGRNKGKKFDWIYIEQSTSENNIIYADVVNEAIKYLKEEGEDYLKFAFVDPQAEVKNEIQMYNPSEMTEDQENVTAHIGINGEQFTYVNKGDLSNLKAEAVHLWFDTWNYDLVEVLKNYFGGSCNVRTEGADADGWVDIREGGASIALYNIDSALEANPKYIISTKPYRGEEYTWEDGTHVLSIDEYGFSNALSSFTEENLLAVLEEWAGEKFDEINIVYPGDYDSVISKDIWNAALNILKNREETIDGRLPMLITYFEDEAGYAEGWRFAAPAAVEEDVILNVVFDITDKAVMQLLTDGFAAEDVSLEIQTNGSVNIFEPALGVGEKQLQLNEEGEILPADVFVNYNSGEESWYTWGVLDISGLQNLDANVAYTLNEYEYRGLVGYMDGEVHSLYINAEAVEKEKLTAADIAFISYYEETGIKFGEITVEQKYASSNVIKKELINALRAILTEEGTLNFVFCRCEENGGNDIMWTLHAPGEAQKDINANATITTPANQGLKVMFNANTYNAGSVDFLFGAELRHKFGQDIMTAVEGAGTTKELESCSDDLLVLTKGTEPDFNKNVGYERDADVAVVTVSNVQEYEAKVSYTLSQVNYIEPSVEVFEVGVPYNWDDRLNNTPAGAVTWKSLSENIVDLAKDGTLTAVNPGMFIVTGTYKTDGKATTEIWIGMADIILKDISFSQALMEVSENDRYHYLTVQTYPANAAIEATDLEWSSSDETVAVVNRYGDVEVTGVGTTEITATVPGTEIKATCEFTVVPAVNVPQESIEQLMNLFAVTNLDATLADVALPEGFTWKEPATKLNTYVGVEGSYFDAIYTNENGYTKDWNLWLPFMTIQGINLNAVDFDMSTPLVVKGDSVAFTYEFMIENGSIERLQQHPKFSELTFKPTGMVESEDNECQFIFVTDEKTSVGKKTVKLAAMYGKKTIASASAVLQVTKEIVAGFEDVTYDPAFDENEQIIPNTDQLVFWNPENYYKVTVTSSDTSVLKFGKIIYPTAAEIAEAKENGTPLKVLIPYTEGKAGDVLVTQTLADAVKTSRQFVRTVVDSEPKIIETGFTINTSYDLKKAPITIQFANHFLPIEDLAIVNDTKGFAFELDAYDASAKKSTGYITLPENTTLKAGTYTVTLRAVVEQSGHGVKEYNIPIKVKVATTKPSVTFKQTKKINTFFNQSEGDQYHQPEGYGLLTFTSKTDMITNVSMVADDFEMYDVEGTYFVFYKPDDDGKDEKKVTITYDVVHPEYGTITDMEKSLTLSTENKAPSLELNAKSMTLYPGCDYTGFYVWNKATGRNVDLTNVSLVKSAKEVIALSNNGLDKTEVKVGKNDYALCSVDGMIWIDLISRVQGADTLKFRLQEENWSKPVDVSFKVDVKTAAPKIKLSNSKLTLNINENVYFNEIASADIQLPGYNQFLENAEVTFTANDAKSKAVLNDEIKLSTDGRVIYARFNFDPGAPVSERPSGSYSFKVWISNGSFQTSANFTVSIVNKPALQGIKLTKSGSIDVLNREDTYLIYTPKLTNLTGRVYDVEVIGQDANNFHAQMDMDGRINLYAYEGTELSTAVTYKVAFRLRMVNFAEDGAIDYVYESPVQSFKVTQGKPKVTITSPMGATIYSQAGNALNLEIDAFLKDKAVEIEEVTLANYDGDLDLVYDAENQIITLSRKKVDSYYTRMKEITKMGKAWNLKLNVKFKDQAGNVKDTQVTYKVTVK